MSNIPQPQTFPSDNSFSAIAGEWISSMKPQLKESSIVKYTNLLSLYLLPSFGARPITEINREDIMEFCRQMLLTGGRKGKGLSPKTVTGIVSLTKSIFAYAARTKNLPVADIKGIYIKQPQKPMRILSRTEQQILNKYLCDHPTPCNLGILLTLYTGLRIGEICALKWEDISLSEQYLYIHQTMQRLQNKNQSEKKTRISITAPKSCCSIRKIPLPDEIFRLITKVRYPADSFFLTGSSSRYMEPRTMQNHFKAVVKNCEMKDVNFHALRHTFATRCIELGFDVKSLSEILGHASVNITMNRYVHPSMELKQKNMNMLSDLLSVN